MVKLIVGDKGKGKTKHLLDMANDLIKSAEGSVVYLDKSTKHMYELNRNIRLINVKEFPVVGTEGFLGFVAGILSQDRDLQCIFLDSFLKLASLENKDCQEAIEALEKLSEKTGVDFVLSISLDEHMLPEALKKYVVVSL